MANDLGVKYTDKKIEYLTHKINGIYKEARKDINSKMKDFNEKYKAKEAKYAQQVKEGKITQEQFDNWKKGQVFQGKQWQAKKQEIENVLHNSNVLASNMINSERIDVFGFNINYSSYSIEKSVGVNFGFSVYDRNTVINLLKNEPNLLPAYTPKKGLDNAWNSKKITRQVTLGIIQGEKLDQIADRLARVTSSQDRNSMLTHARTLMTGAQNAGRLESYKQAEKLGIDMEKEWMATLDGHTRDSHADVDGERQPIEHKFSNDCMYPGDPGGPPAEVYNCRCTMVSNVKKYPAKYQRRDNINGKRVDSISYKDWYEAKTGKDFLVKGSQEKKYQKAKADLEKLEQHIKDVGADETFKDIWYNQDVTYADWESKKDSVEQKIEYYENKIKAYKDNFYNDTVGNDLAGKDLFDALSEFHFKGDALADKNLLKLLDDLDLSKDDFNDIWILYTDAKKHITESEALLEQVKKFKENGEAYSKLLKERDEAKTLVTSLKPKMDPSKTFSAESYSKARKDAAFWAKSSEDADNVLRPMTQDVWQNASQSERYAAWNYTAGSGPFNRPLRGYEGSWYNFKGVGNVDLNYEGAGKDIENLTNIISKSTLKQDTWLQRGVDEVESLAKFLQVSESDLKTLGQEELENLLVGKEVTDQAFMSCGSAKGKGFVVNNTLNIYCPEGTQALYYEPFSRFGHGGGKDWDGISKQSSFGSELETLIQRNSSFKITKVEKNKYGRIFIDMDVVDQRP